MENENLNQQPVQEAVQEAVQETQTDMQPSASSAPVEVQMRAQALFAQAQAIRQMGGMDVMNLFDTDVEVRQKVLSGQWDFLDVWRETAQTSQPPVPVRSANGGVGGVNIGAMNSRQFQKLNELIERGGKIDMTC